MSPETYELLCTLKELVKNEDSADVLLNCYGINLEDPDDARLDLALAAWRSATDGTMIWTPKCDDDGCHGVILSESSKYGLQVERCDDCSRFDNDEDATLWLAMNLNKMVLVGPEATLESIRAQEKELMDALCGVGRGGGQEQAAAAEPEGSP